VRWFLLCDGRAGVKFAEDGTAVGLDVYHVHWYDRRNRRAPLEAPIAETLDRPLWLGESPTSGSSRTVPEILETARLAGYAAALGWSAEAGDRWSNVDGLADQRSRPAGE
jgi:hypothetical protein